MPSNPLTDPHWAQRSVDFIDRIVVFIRAHTTRPLVKSARVVVFGFLASLGAVSLFVLVCVAIARGLQAALDAVVTHEASVWISYFVLSALLFVAGIVLMKHRHERDP
ncbi:MAG: hypothetical protein EXQ63_05310 [Ilumatobacteraceae bacterium]|nr:hypothetical protein [Ilumatobacteraceae bacterium]